SEQSCEQVAEMCVHRIEGGLQAALALGVDLGDARTQLGNGGLDVNLLRVHAVELLGEAREVLVSLQVDAAQPLTVGLEAQKLGVRLVEAGELSVRFELGKRKAGFRCTSESVANLASFLAATDACCFQSRLRARARLAFVGHRALCRTQRLRSFAMGGFGCGERVGRGLPVGFRLASLSHY